MPRSSGAPFIGWGIGLAVIGLILALAVKDMVPNVNLTMIGWILTGAGALAALIGLIMSVTRSTTTATTVVEPTVNGGEVRRDDVRH